MKAISLIQPWATLVIHGVKRIETRAWKTPHRGPLAIHASKTIPCGHEAIFASEPFKTALANTGHPTWSSLPLGKLLGAVELVDCQPTENVSGLFEIVNVTRELGGTANAQMQVDGHAWELSPQEQAFGNFSAGRFAWFLANPSPLVVPCPFSGRIGLFEVADQLWQAALALR